jgi:hypothetical protein
MPLNRKTKFQDNLTLPKLPRLHKIPLSQQSNNSLPSFPSSQLGDKMSQEAIKSSLQDSFESSLDYPKGYQEEEPLEDIPGVPEIEKPLPIPKPLSIQAQETPASKAVFVKIENFKQALELFKDIKNKIEEIEGLMTEIREVKKREEYELEEWKKEVEFLKGKLEQIDKKLFSKI